MAMAAQTIYVFAGPPFEIIFSVIAVASLILFLLLNSIRQRASLGMLFAGAHFCAASSEHLSARRCAWRVVLGWIMLPFFPISFLFMLFDPLSRTPADWISKVGMEPGGKVEKPSEEEKGS
jgi:uncharacterized RDD family membrane protein YckC